MRKITVIVFVSLMLASCAGYTSRAEINFANRLAQEGLWKEALFRWEKLYRKNQESPALLNNMAVAMEQLGKRQKAEELYQKALSLAPENPQIKNNFERFKKKPDTQDQKNKSVRKHGKSKRNIPRIDN